ncbi:MAG: hypothetical protein O7F71_06235, partial [Gammaproteobacteria bacterium]|nr:hypothetical protein [Gammaproteobacteria bacterium]
QPATSFLMHDTTGERRDAKENSGYVTPESATAFLKLTRLKSLASLIDGDNHDPVSARYFSQLGARPQKDDSDDSDDGSDDEDGSYETDQTEQAHVPDAHKLNDLEKILLDAEIVNTGFSGLLLAAPEQEDVLPVKAALDGLQELDPGLFTQRLSELVYLSNVLIAGTALDGKRFGEVDAAHAVLATCNIGMSYFGEGSGDDQSVRDGLVRLFRIGWQILQQIPLHTADRLVTSLRSKKVTKSLFDRAWILSEVDATLDEFIGHVRAARFAEVKDALFFISLILSQETCDALQMLINDYPRYPLDDTLRHFESIEDIANLDAFMTSLADHAKL